MAVEIRVPTKEEALQFAILLGAGMPASEAIDYFIEEGASPAERRNFYDKWVRSERVKKACLELQGKPWQDMGLEDRIKFAIDKQYGEMAYYLYSRNYVELSGADKQKADTCRQVLEAKVAGMAGKMDALSTFFDDVLKGKIKLESKKTGLLPTPAN